MQPCRKDTVYADFDYPSKMADFVRYMPSTAPDLGSLELNEARVYRRWRAYLEECTRKYAASSEPR